MQRRTMTRSAAGCGGIAALILAGSSAAAGGDGCAPNLNGDGVVDVADVLILLEAWGPNPGHPADFNDDGVVDSFDLGYMLGHWGPCFESLPLPDTAELAVIVEEVTLSPTVWDESLRTYDVLVELNDPDERLLNVYDVTIDCDAAICFYHAAELFPPLATPLSEQLWNTLDLTYDSFITIGPAFSDNNQVMVDPSFLAVEQQFLVGESLGPDSGWLLMPNDEQGLAGTYPGNRIRVARLTVPMDVTLSGELTVMFQAEDDALYEATASFERLVPPMGDLTGDGVVGGADLGVLLSEWGTCDEPTPESCPADLNMDGSVDGADLGILLSNWTK